MDDWVSTLGSFIGIYMLTLNQDSDKQDQLIGYVMVFLAAWCYGLVFICLRLLNLNGVHNFVGPFYIGISAVLTTIIVFIISLDMLHVIKYNSTDLMMLSCNGI